MVEAKKKSEQPTKIKINTESFIHENTGNIKDFYKISSCIGRGKWQKSNWGRRLRRGAEVSAQGDQGT
jgi:hypothetical protein